MQFDIEKGEPVADTKEKEHTLHDVKEAPKDKKDDKEAIPRDNEGPVVFDYVEPKEVVPADPVPVKSTYWVIINNFGSNDLGPFDATPDAVTAGQIALAGVVADSFTVEQRYTRIPEEETP